MFNLKYNIIKINIYFIFELNNISLKHYIILYRYSVHTHILKYIQISNVNAEK